MQEDHIDAPPADRLQRCYLPLLLLVTAGYCLVSLTARVDFWGHAAVGRWIIEHRQIPHHTLYLWSANIPWIWHSWLSQVLFYELLAHVSENIGALLATLLTALAASFSLLLWWKVWLRHQGQTQQNHAASWPMLAIFLLAIYTAHSRFHPRPEIFSAVLFTLVLWLLVRGITSWRPAIAIFLLFVLWANLHAGLASGLAVLWITAICEFAQQRRFRQTRWIFAAALLATAAVFVNPYGWHYWTALQQVGGITFSYIDEWKPFWKYPLFSTPTVMAAALCALAALPAWCFSDRRRWAHLAWLIMAVAMFLIARRNVWIFAQLTLAVIAANPRIYAMKPWLFPRGRMQFVAACALLIAAFTVQSPTFWKGHFASSHLPDRAAQRLRELAPGHRVFNNYEMSSYLQWKLHGNPPLFIDLLNAYPAKIMQDYIAVNDGSYRTKAVLEKWKCDIIILQQPNLNHHSTLLANWLAVNYPWKLIYSDNAAMIWKKLPLKHSRKTF